MIKLQADWAAGNDEVSCIFTVREQSDLDDFCSDVKTPVRVPAPTRPRHASSTHIFITTATSTAVAAPPLFIRLTCKIMRG